MSKLPAIQFYPADWRKDPAVQSLGYHDRGVWFEILCLMHESEQRGKLLLNGNPMPLDALGRLLGLDNQTLTTTLTMLLTYGVARQEIDTGIIYNKRMVEDEKLRQVRKECGKLGGNPQLKKDLLKQISTTQLKQIPTPSSSSSSSSSSLDNNIVTAAPVAKTKRFIKPTPQEVTDYAKEIQFLGLDAEYFCSFYDSKGWLVGKSPMKDWKATVRTWRKNNFIANKNTGTSKTSGRNAGTYNANGLNDYSIFDKKGKI